MAHGSRSGTGSQRSSAWQITHPRFPTTSKNSSREYQAKVASGEVKIFDLPDEQLWTYGTTAE